MSEVIKPKAETNVVEATASRRAAELIDRIEVQSYAMTGEVVEIARIEVGSTVDDARGRNTGRESGMNIAGRVRMNPAAELVKERDQVVILVADDGVVQLQGLIRKGIAKPGERVSHTFRVVDIQRTAIPLQQAVHPRILCAGAHSPRRLCVPSSLKMLQKSTPWPIASSSATCVCGSSPNHDFGMFFLVASRYEHPRATIAAVLMSRAECEKGLSPANRMRYQYTNMKS